MKQLGMAAVLAAAMVAGSGAQAGPIERGCLKSDRPGSRALCACIQQVADASLTYSDQRLAAKFFRKPDMAQEIRMSDKRSHEVFWRRYKAFGAQAEQVCARHG